MIRFGNKNTTTLLFFFTFFVVTLHWLQSIHCQSRVSPIFTFMGLWWV